MLDSRCKTLGFSLLSSLLFLSTVFTTACSGDVTESGQQAGGAGGASGTGGAGGASGTGGAAGAGGSAGAETGGSGGAAGQAGAGAQGGAAGSAGSAGAAGPSETFAISYLYLGDTDENGTPGPNAWEGFGEDIDGQDTDENATHHCSPQPGASTTAIQTDGDGGIDNSFGANLMPLFMALSSNMSAQFNEGIQDGLFTHLLWMKGWFDVPAGTPLPTSAFTAAPLGHPPLWDGSDAWPLRCEYMTTCLDVGTPQLSAGNDSLTSFPSSVIVNGVWDSSSTADFHFGIALAGATWDLPIGHTHMTFDFSSGMLSGVIDTEAALEALQEVAGFISVSLCEGPTMDAILAQIRSASDIMVDGTQDPGQLCNGISIGLGFEAAPAQLGPVGNKEPVVPDPCQGI